MHAIPAIIVAFRHQPLAELTFSNRIGPVRQNQIPPLKDRNAPCSDQEWQSTLEALVRGEPQDGIQATATIQASASVTLTLRKRVGDVTVSFAVADNDVHHAGINLRSENDTNEPT